MSRSFSTTGTTTTAPSRTRRPGLAWALAGLEVFVGVNAVVGGWRLIADGFGLPTEWLATSPVDSWVWPGIALIAGVAGPQFAAAAAALGRHADLGYRFGLVAGGALVLWIVIQLAVLQHYFFLQPVIAAFGLIEIGLALWWRRSLGRAG